VRNKNKSKRPSTAKYKAEVAKYRTVQELPEKEKQIQATIDDLTKTVETFNQTVKMLCGQPQDVSLFKLSKSVN
jgi:hypothetical protein